MVTTLKTTAVRLEKAEHSGNRGIGHTATAVNTHPSLNCMFFHYTQNKYTAFKGKLNTWNAGIRSTLYIPRQ